MYWYWRGKGSGLRAVGVALILLGALLLIWVVPPQLWAAILGLAMIVLGAVLLRLG